MILRRFLAAILASSGLIAQTPPSDLVQQARKLNAEGKQAEALALYGQALKADSNLFDARLGAGVALDMEGKYREARQQLTKAIELASAQGKTQALKAMAISYAFEKKADEAEKFEKQVYDTQLTEGNFVPAAETCTELARIYLESGNPDQAYKWYQTGYKTAQRKADLTAAERDLWDLRWEHAQARIAARRGNGSEAKKHLAAVKALIDKGTNPDQARFLPYLAGYVAFYTGDTATAITELQKADQRDPFILSLLAQAEEKSGNKEQALELYRKILTINTHNPTNAFARPLAQSKTEGQLGNPPHSQRRS